MTRKEYDQQRTEFDSLSPEKKLKAKATRKVKTDIAATIEGFNVKAHSQSATIQVGIQESENWAIILEKRYGQGIDRQQKRYSV